MAVNENMLSAIEEEGRGSFRWKLIETVTSTMKHKDEVSSSNKEFWVRIARLMCSKEVLTIWKKMKKRVAQKAIAHIVNGDIPLMGADEEKNLMPLDWLMYDRFLVINCTDSSLKLFEEDITTKQQHTMIMIFHFVQKFHIEGLMHKNPAALPQAWWTLCVEYCKCGRRGSVMLLQWRWHMMKMATRSIFYKYWAGGARKKMSIEDTFKPKPIHIAIAKRYPHVVVEELPTWQQFLATDKIVLPDQVENLLMSLQEKWVETVAPHEGEKSEADEANEDDDLVLIEPETDTIDLLDDSDENALEANMEQLLIIDRNNSEMDLKVRTEVYDYTNSVSKEVGMDVRPIKIEPDLKVIENHIDYTKRQGLESIRVQNVQSVKLIDGNCEVEKAKAVDINVEKDVSNAKSDEGNVIVIEDESPRKTVEILDKEENFSKSQKKIDDEVKDKEGKNSTYLDKGEELNEDEEEDIIMITEENVDIHEPLETNRDIPAVLAQMEHKKTEEYSISSGKDIIINVDKEETVKELNEEKKKSEENLKEKKICGEDLRHDVDLDECQEVVDEVLDIDDVTLKSLERQHITMKFDKTHTVAAIPLHNVKKETTSLSKDSPFQEHLNTSFAKDVKLTLDCAVKILKLEDMLFFKNKRINRRNTVNVKGFICNPQSELATIEFAEKKQVLIVGIRDANELLIAHSAVPVECHAQKTRSILSNICERKRSQMQRKKKNYEPDEILRNPDFEPKLLDLPNSFYTIPENVRLLKACIPATVDLVADFSIADNNGMVEVVDTDLVTTYKEMMGISEEDVNLGSFTKKLNKTQELKSQETDTEKPVHILDKIMSESRRMGEIHKAYTISKTSNMTQASANQSKVDEEIPIQMPVHEEMLVRKSKPICLPSISEIRKINQGIKTAQVAPIIPQNSMFATNDDSRIGEVLAIEYEPPTSNLPPAKLVFNKKGVSFISAAQPLKATARPVPRWRGCSPWYKPKAAKFEANLSMSSLCAMLKSLEPQLEDQNDSLKQKKKRYCCSLKRHHVLNDARRRLVNRRSKEKPKYIRVLNIHKHKITECDCCCKGLFPESLDTVMKIDNALLNDDATASKCPEIEKIQEHNEDDICVVDDDCGKLIDKDKESEINGKEENITNDQCKQSTYLRVLTPSELMATKPTSIDSETQTDLDLAGNVSIQDCVIYGENQNCSSDVKPATVSRVPPVRKYTRKKPVPKIKKVPQQRRKRAARNTVNTCDAPDERQTTIVSSITPEQEAALVSVGPIANPVLKISCVLSEMEQNAIDNKSISKEPVFQQPPDAEILITDVKSAEEIASSVTSLFEDKFKPIMPDETMIPVLVLNDELVPLAQDQPESLGLNLPKRDDQSQLKEVTEETDDSITNKSEVAQGNAMLMSIIDKLGLDPTDPLLTSSSMNNINLANCSEVTSYIVCDQMNVPKQCVVINKSSNKILHTINLPHDKKWDVRELQKKIWPGYITLNEGDDLNILETDNETNIDMTLTENDVIDMVNDERNGDSTVKLSNGSSFAGVIDVSVLHEVNANQAINVLTSTDLNSTHDTAVLELLPKSQSDTDVDQSEIYKNTSHTDNHGSTSTNEIIEMENQGTQLNKSISRGGSSILFDLMDQLGINSETVSCIDTNSTIENTYQVGDNNQVVIQLEPSVLETNSIVYNSNIVNQESVQEQPKELPCTNKSSAKTRPLFWNEEIAKQLGYIQRPTMLECALAGRISPDTKSGKSSIKTFNSGNYLGSDQLNVKPIAENTFTIITEETNETNSRNTSIKKSHLRDVINTNSLLVERKAIRITKRQAKAKIIDEDFVVKRPRIQYVRKNTARHLRPKTKHNLKESSDEDDTATSLSCSQMEVMDTVHGPKAFQKVAHSHVNRCLKDMGDMLPSTSHIKKKRKTLKNVEAIINLDEDSSPGSPEYLEEEYLDDSIIDFEDIQDKKSPHNGSQEDGKEDSELILGM